MTMGKLSKKTDHPHVLVGSVTRLDPMGAAKHIVMPTLHYIQTKINLTYFLLVFL